MKVDEIVNELKYRMRLRGDTAQIQRAEQTLLRLENVDGKLVSLLSRLICSDNTSCQH